MEVSDIEEKVSVGGMKVSVIGMDVSDVERQESLLFASDVCQSFVGEMVNDSVVDRWSLVIGGDRGVNDGPDGDRLLKVADREHVARVYANARLDVSSVIVVDDEERLDIVGVIGTWTLWSVC